MAEDLEKLTYFRRDLKDLGGSPRNHDAAYFWLYGLPIAEWPKLRREVLDLLGNSKNFDRDLISCVIHPSSGVRATRVPWT